MIELMQGFFRSRHVHVKKLFCTKFLALPFDFLMIFFALGL